jgi:hypothetical protein
MDDQILAVYCLMADILNAIGHAEDPQQQMSDAEVITTGLVAMWFFRGNFEAARALLSMPRYMPHMLSRSRLNRRLHRLTDLFVRLFDLLGDKCHNLSVTQVSIPRCQYTGKKRWLTEGMTWAKKLPSRPTSRHGGPGAAGSVDACGRTAVSCEPADRATLGQARCRSSLGPGRLARALVPATSDTPDRRGCRGPGVESAAGVEGAQRSGGIWCRGDPPRVDRAGPRVAPFCTDPWPHPGSPRSAGCPPTPAASAPAAELVFATGSRTRRGAR